MSQQFITVISVHYHYSVQAISLNAETDGNRVVEIVAESRLSKIMKKILAALGQFKLMYGQALYYTKLNYNGQNQCILFEWPHLLPSK